MSRPSLPQLQYLIATLEKMESFDMGSWYHLGPNTLVSVSMCACVFMHLQDVVIGPSGQSYLVTAKLSSVPSPFAPFPTAAPSGDIHSPPLQMTVFVVTYLVVLLQVGDVKTQEIPTIANITGL